MAVRRFAVSLFIAALTALAASGQNADDPLLKKLESRAAAIRPPACDCRWQQIPWVIDLKLALEQAKGEKRPIMFWAAGGRDRDGVPIERC
jgi:hypothetical protein